MKKLIISILLIIIITASGLFFYKYYKFSLFIHNIKEYVELNDYFVYGNHLNIKIDSDKEYTLVLKSSDEELEYNLNDILSNKINEGFNLEELNNGKYYLLLKYNNKYYGIKNKSDYNKTIYYSFSNKKMTISSDKIMYINVENTNEKIYDIVIDAGHGGKDTGAINGNYEESYYTLKYAQALSDKLTQMGYKVKLTRNSEDGIKTYGIHSRTSLPYESHAKYVFSIHFNSSEDYIYQSGAEIYCPNKTNLDFARNMIKNIVDNTSITYSTNTAFKKERGIYVRTFRDSEIKYMNDEADKYNYKHYNITNETPYLYMLRETGGRITHAYTDGRNQNGDKNPYYNSNIGVEAYLLELGYINNSRDLDIIKSEKKKYIDAIAESIDEHIKNNT